MWAWDRDRVCSENSLSADGTVANSYCSETSALVGPSAGLKCHAQCAQLGSVGTSRARVERKGAVPVLESEAEQTAESVGPTAYLLGVFPGPCSGIYTCYMTLIMTASSPMFSAPGQSLL